MSEGIQGKVVLIAGGAGGIGSETAKVLGSRGAVVAVADINVEKSGEVVEAIRSAGGDARSYKVDITDKDEIKSVVETVIADFGRIDVLINAAGIMLIRPLSELNVEEWETTIDLNFKGTLWTIAAVLPGFLERNSGHIINLGSVHGLKVSPGSAVHSASKFAVGALSEGLRLELASRSIRVTTVVPGAVDTGMQNKTTGTDRARMLAIYKNAISPKAVADVIAFATGQSANVALNEIVVRPTGQEI